MRKIPKSEVPKIDSEGARYRARQVFYQLPKQDFNSKYANFLKEDAKISFYGVGKFRLKSALGIGNFFQNNFLLTKGKMNISISFKMMRCVKDTARCVM